MRRFTLFSPGGLSNRLKVLVSAKVLADAAGAELDFMWPLDDACRCPFERLFEPDRRVRTVGQAEVGGFQHIVGWDLAPPDLLVAGDVAFGHMSWLVRPDLYPAHAALWPRLAPALDGLRPTPAIAEAVATFVRQRFRPRMIGVHLRRGDFHFERPDVIANSEAAMTLLARRLGAEPEAGVFLATDDGAPAGDAGNLEEGVRGLLQARFGERVVFTEPRSLDRSEPEAIEDALVDLLLLRKTIAIIGTARSSFSELAAFGRPVPLEMATGTQARFERLERFTRRVGLYPLIIALATRRLGRRPESFFLAWKAVRYSPDGERVMRVVRWLLPRWRP